MTLDEITERGISPALRLLPARMNSAEAGIMLLTIGLQESRFLHRRQLVGNPPRPTGPAKGFWQFERGGGVTGVMTHAATSGHAKALCQERGVTWGSSPIWDALEHDDVLAAGFARLLLWSDPGALPRVTDTDGGWKLYLRTWRPGAYTRGTPAERAQLRAKWDGHHRQARRYLRMP